MARPYNLNEVVGDPGLRLIAAIAAADRPVPGEVGALAELHHLFLTVIHAIWRPAATGGLK